jgi:hypothetical protein
LSDTVSIEDLDPVPDLPRQVLIPPDVSWLALDLVQS